MSRYEGWRDFALPDARVTAAVQKVRTTAKSSGVPFDRLCALQGLPAPIAEYRFHPIRKWRFDWAFPDAKVALEIHGGTWIQGKHSRGVGQRVDFCKWSHAAALGWRIIHVVPEQLESTQSLEWLKECLT